MGLAGVPIVMAPTEAGQTKALLDGQTFAAEGNQIKVYDYFTAPSADYEVPTDYYINGDIATSNGSAWPFAGKHEWTTDGVHKFFGWMEKDNSDPSSPITASGFFGTGFGFADGVLTIPAKTLSQTGTPQFDFMYSDIEPRDLTGDVKNFSKVDMDFRHLFTAFKVTAANVSSNKVWLKNVTIENLKNTRSAQIDYRGNDADITYGVPISAANFTYSLSDEGKELVKNATAIQLSDYTIMWPQSTADFGNAQIVVNYDYQEQGSTRMEGTTTIPLFQMKPWNAGKKNDVALSFKDKEISLTCNVEPWEVMADTLDFTDQISVSNPITWIPNSVESVDYEKGEVVLYTDSYSVAVCNFRIDTPAGATWTASLIPVEGYSDAFKILDNTKYGAVGVDSEVHIQVTNMAPIAPRHVVLLRITVQTADGRTIVADMMPKQTDESITEYKLIQNLING